MIVVGVDGSSGSELALRWALAESRVRQTNVRAVHAWLAPASTGWGYLPPELFDTEALTRGAQETVEDAVRKVAGEDSEVEIEAVAREGAADDVLCEEAASAELLVVGSRGHGGFTGLLLGSVGQQCAHRASCPVVIVRRPTAKVG